jgi:hypothetical protein
VDGAVGGGEDDAALMTFLVPSTATGTSSCGRDARRQREQSTWRIAAACTVFVKKKKKKKKNEQAVTTTDRGGDVEDAVAAGEGGAEGVAVEDVGAAQGEALLIGALQSQQVRVLAVRCASTQ